MEIQGVFHSYVYPVQDNGYGILRVRVGPASYAVCEPRNCSAPIGLTEGTPLTLIGDYRDGKQPNFPFYCEPGFLFDSAVQSMPQDEASAVEFVRNMNVRGIAEMNAKHIIAVTGADIEAYFRNNPDAHDFHKKIPSVTVSAASAFIRRIMTTTTEKHLLDYAHGCGFTYTDAFKLYDVIVKDVGHECTFDEVMDILSPQKMNAQGVVPRALYYYCAKAGVSFDSTDHLAKKLGYRPYNQERLKSLLLSVLQRFESSGHVWSDLQSIYDACCNSIMKSAFPKDVISRWALYAAIKTGKGLFVEEGHGERVYMESSWFDEHSIVSGVQRIQASKKVLPYYDSIISEIERERNVKFSAAQRSCFDFLKHSGVHIVTGGAGTGKTTIISGLLTAYTRLNPQAQVALCAPTGRAAQRMTELCSTYGSNVKAFTIHKLLDFVPFEAGAKPSFDGDNPLQADMLIVDEMSMVDMHLFAMLISAIKDGALVILCGDVNQLPSVGAGKVFWDLIDSEKFNVVRLTANYRQANVGGSNTIIENATRINAGKWVMQHGPDFETIVCDTDADISDAVLKLAKNNPNQTILSTVREGVAGVTSLNNLLQPILNPKHGKSVKCGRYTFREHDFILMTRNNYDVGYVNGDVGHIVSIGDGEMKIKLGNEEKTVCREDYVDISLAYAMTIHKSQGSEYDNVIVVLPSSAPNMLARNLLYTAVTRAKKHVTIIGREDAIRNSVRNIRNQERRTTLKDLLRR